MIIQKHDKILRITLDTYREKFKTFEWDNMKIEDERIIVYNYRIIIECLLEYSSLC